MKCPTLNRKDAATYLGVSVSTLARWGMLRMGPPFLKIGKFARYRISDLDEYMSSRAVDMVANDQ